MVRITYLLGWLCLLLAMGARVALLSHDIAAMMIEVNVLPRNFLELSFLFFLACVASDAYHRAQPKSS